MKKTTTYARRLARKGGGQYNSAEFYNTIQRCQPYTTETLPGSWITQGTQVAADKALVRVRMALQRLKSGDTPRQDTHDFDVLGHAFGVATIRAEEIAGGDANTNPLLPAIYAGASALRRALDRRHRVGTWGVDGPADNVELAVAVNVYEIILQSSSPAQMSAAADRRMQVLAGRMQTPLKSLETTE